MLMLFPGRAGKARERGGERAKKWFTHPTENRFPLHHLDISGPVRCIPGLSVRSRLAHVRRMGGVVSTAARVSRVGPVPPGTAHISCTAHHRSCTTYHRSFTAYHRPCTAYQRSCTGYHRSFTAYHRSFTAYHRSFTAYHRSRTAYHRSCTAYHRYCTAFHRSLTTHHRSCTT